MEQPTDCSKLKLIPKSGRSDLSGGGTAQSVTWKEDIIKIYINKIKHIEPKIELADVEN